MTLSTRLPSRKQYDGVVAFGLFQPSDTLTGKNVGVSSRIPYIKVSPKFRVILGIKPRGDLVSKETVCCVGGKVKH